MLCCLLVLWAKIYMVRRFRRLSRQSEPQCCGKFHSWRLECDKSTQRGVTQSSLISESCWCQLAGLSSLIGATRSSFPLAAAEVVGQEEGERLSECQPGRLGQAGRLIRAHRGRKAISFRASSTSASPNVLPFPSISPTFTQWKHGQCSLGLAESTQLFILK